MNCPRKFLGVGLVACLAGAVAAVPQSTQPPSPAQSSGPAPSLREPAEPRAGIHRTVSLVVVPVTVKDGAGNLVTDLGKNDFRIFEDGIEQQIAVFSADAVPLSAAILVDDDLKRSSADKVQKTLVALAGGFSASDEVSLWRFDEVPQALSDFTTDNNTLLAQLKRIDLSSSFSGVGSVAVTGGPPLNGQPQPGQPPGPAMSIGQTNYKHIHDAIYAAAEQLRDRAPDRRKLIYLISDGRNARNNTHNYKETLELLLSADVSVYAIGIGDPNVNHRITFLGRSILAKYAHATGGDIFYAAIPGDLEALYARVSEQARNQYTIAYSAAQTDHTKPYHSIEVRVERPGLSLLARDGYYLNARP
jgi:VWFA-related protein